MEDSAALAPPDKLVFANLRGSVRPEVYIGATR